MNVPIELQSLGQVFTKATALGAGVSAYWLDQAASSGELDRLSPGVFRLPVALDDGTPVEPGSRRVLPATSGSGT